MPDSSVLLHTAIQTRRLILFSIYEMFLLLYFLYSFVHLAYICASFAACKNQAGPKPREDIPTERAHVFPKVGYKYSISAFDRTVLPKYV